MAAKLDPNMRALKRLVIVLGVLLVAGLVALVAAVVYRLDHRAVATAANPLGGAVFRVALPPGAKIVGTDIANNRLVARIELAGGGERLLLFDLASGASVATIEIAPESASAASPTR
jgi:hypothetical protein